MEHAKHRQHHVASARVGVLGSNLIPPLQRCGDLGKLLNCSVPQFPLL